MSNLKTVITFFENPTLNQIGAEIIDLYRGYQDDVALIKQKMGSAIERRFKVGKYLSENMEVILEECGSQRMFGEKLGYSEATISNDKRAFETLRDQGVTEVDQLVPFLRGKDVPATTYSWERMTKLLNEPQTERQRDQRPRDEKRLESLYDEVEEIRARNESSNPHLAELASDNLKYIDDVKEYIERQNPYFSGWRSRKYLDFVKSIGFDYITGNQEEFLDPHHTLPNGKSLGKHGKVADVFTIPVSRHTHEQIESGMLVPSKLEIAEALVKTMALFITSHYE